MFKDELLGLINAHLNRVLQAAAIGIGGDSQYKAYRTFTLDEFGQKGFLPELDGLLKRYGVERAGTKQQERGCQNE